MVVHFFPHGREEYMAKVQIFPHSWMESNGLARWSKIGKKKGSLGKKFMDGTLVISTKFEEFFLCPTSMFNKEKTLQRRLNNQMGEDDLLCGYQSVFFSSHPNPCLMGSWMNWPY